MKKKIKLSLVAAITACLFMPLSNANGQNIYDAYRYSQQQWEGTARSMAMGNAGVALGGDMGNIAINPAASGVYRYSEILFSPGVTSASSKVSYLGNNMSDNKTRFGVASFGYVGSFETGRTTSGLINWNIGVVFNKANNYTSRMSAGGRTDQSSWLASLAQNTNGINSPQMNINDNNDPFYNGIPWKSVLGWNTSLLDNYKANNQYIGATENIYTDEFGYDYIGMAGAVDQRYTNEVVGSANEVSINFGGNISNKLFFGFNLGIQNIWYKYSDTYSETAVNSSNFQTGFEHFSHSYTTRTSGTGVNLKFGLIYLPFKGLRLGASIATPTWMYLYDEWEESMSARLAGTATSEPYKQTLSSPIGNYNYQVNTPFRWNVGAAYTFGKFGALSVDYERVDYSQIKMNDRDNFNSFAEDNRMIKQTFTHSNILRAGAEIKIVPEVAFRAGYQYYSNGEIGYNETFQYGSIGLGYVSQSGFFADVAYQQQLKKSIANFQLYDNLVDDVTATNPNVVAYAPEGINKLGNFKVLLTLGFRF